MYGYQGWGIIDIVMYYSTTKLWPATTINADWNYFLVSKITIYSVGSGLFRRCNDGFMSQ